MKLRREDVFTASSFGLLNGNAAHYTLPMLSPESHTHNHWLRNFQNSQGSVLEPITMISVLRLIDKSAWQRVGSGQVCRSPSGLRQRCAVVFKESQK
jgi:hypothetical protein